MDYVDFIVDTSGDDIPDEVAEMDLCRPERPVGVWNPKLDIDPTVEDTTGDELADAEQVDIDWWIDWNQELGQDGGAGDVLHAEVTNVDAHPARVDTVGNNFTDHDESEYGTNPLKWDYAGDGVPDGDDPNPLVHNGWTVHIWTESHLVVKDSGAWEHHASTALEEDLSSQIDLKVEVEDRPDVEAVEMGEYPSSRVDCKDDSGTLDDFQTWLEENEEVREGEYHMLLLACFGDIPSVIGDQDLDEVFYSRNDRDGSLAHDPDAIDPEPERDYASGLVNTRVALTDLGSELNEDRFKATVIHEFGHAALDNEPCPLDPEEDDVKSGVADHSCGGITEDGEQTPMIIANTDKISEGEMAIYESDPAYEWVPYGIVGVFTTTLTPHTKEGMEEYHEQEGV